MPPLRKVAPRVPRPPSRALGAALAAAIALLSTPLAGPLVAQTPPPCGPAEQNGVAVNPRLAQHSCFFEKKIYDLSRDPHYGRWVPKGLAYRAYAAVGFDLANTIVLVGPPPANEIVFVDTLGDEETALAVLRAFRDAGIFPKEPAKLPIRAVVYTHNHIDHTAGVEGFLRWADSPACPPESPNGQGTDGTLAADRACVAVVGQKNIVDSVINTGTVVGTIINPRSAYMYGNFLKQGPVNCGIGPQVNGAANPNEGPGFRMPSRTFTNELKLLAGGMRMRLVYVPSETDDELAVFLPDALNGPAGGVPSDAAWGGPGLLLSAEVIQGPSFPNLYSLRGTSYRNPATWFRSVNTLLKLDSWCMLPAHGVPLCGAANIQLLLRNFRDAIQFAHDQAVRFINLGHTPDELPGLVALPEYLVDELKALQPALPRPDMDPRDYLTPFYGSVPQSVRELYFGYLGWFDADPVGLSPVPPKKAAGLLAALVGPERLLAEALGALARGDAQWAAELATILVQADPAKAVEARKVKASAFRALAAPQTNPNWRNWYLTAATELDLLDKRYPPVTGGLTSPEIVAALPPGAWVNSWTMRLDPTKSAGRRVTAGFLFPGVRGVPGPTDQRYTVALERSVAAFRVIQPIAGNDPLEAKDPAKTWAETTFVLSLTRTALLDLLRAEAKRLGEEWKGGTEGPDPFLAALLEAIREGAVPLLKGTERDVAEFFGAFDRRQPYSPPLASR